MAARRFSPQRAALWNYSEERMATKSQQVARLVEFLNDPTSEELTVEEMAKRIVNSFYSLLLKEVKEEPPHLEVGMAFKCALTNKVHHVAWNEGDLYWIVTADSRYGCLGPIGSWRKYAIETKAQAGKPGNNSDGWKVGERVLGYRTYRYTIVATGDKCVLLRPEDGSRPIIEPNDSMEKRYRRIAAPNPMFD